jgi:hypothetical protein
MQSNCECHGLLRRLFNYFENTIAFLWRRDLESVRDNPQHRTIDTTTLAGSKFDSIHVMQWRVASTIQLLPVHHMISMEERFGKCVLLSTTPVRIDYY